MNNSSSKRDFIFQLKEKFESLKGNRVARNICGHNDSENSLAEKLGIPRKTLLDGVGTGALNGGNQLKLAQKCGFSLDWPEWSDPFADRKTPVEKRRDTAEAFIRRYRTEHPFTASNAPAKQRQLGLQLKSVRDYRPAYCDDQLATVELQASQIGPGEPQPLSADLICNPSVIPAGVEIAVKCGWLRMDCGEAPADTKVNVVRAGGYVIERANGKVMLTLGGDSQRPSWEVQAEGGAIGLVSLPHDFCMIHDLAPGDVIRVRFLVYLMDLETVETGEPDEADEAEDGASQSDSRSFLRVGFKKLGSAKQKILKRIAEMQLPGGKDGLAILATDELRFEAVATATESKSATEDSDVG